VSVSVAATDSSPCSNCARPVGGVVWQVIDLVERPDLRAVLRDWAWFVVQCEHCSHEQQRRAPLLLLGLSPEAPALLALDDDGFEIADSVAAHRPLVDRTVAALGTRIREFPSPLISMPLGIVPIATTRDIAADVLSGVVPDPAEVGGEELAYNYAVLLEVLRESRPTRRVNAVVNRLAVAATLDELREVVAEYPEASTPEVVAAFERDLDAATDESGRDAARMRIALARAVAEGRVEEGWSEHERAMVRYGERHGAGHSQELYERLCDESDAADAVEAGESLLELMERADDRSPMRVDVLHRTASAYYYAIGPGEEERTDRAIELCHQAIAIVDEAVGDAADWGEAQVMRARVLLSLGAAYSRRFRGDHIVNQEHAVALQREALELLTFDSDPVAYAMASTNLGVSLVTRAMERPRDSLERRSEIVEALRSFDDALRWRSFERDPLDWAYTQIGLGIAYDNLHGHDRVAELRRAAHHQREAARGMNAAGRPMLEAQAWHNVAAVLNAIAAEVSDEERPPLLRDALEAGNRSLALRPVTYDPVGAGSTWSGMARTYDLAGNDEAARAARRSALDGLRPDTSPHAARTTAWELAEAAIAAGDWDEGADAYDIAARAAVAALEARAGGEGRVEELEVGRNLFRWAANAAVRAGRTRRAVEILELGRARELAVWLRRDVESEELRELRPDLHEKFVALRADLGRFEVDDRAGIPVDLVAAAEARGHYRRTVEEIRELPGFARFLQTPSFEDVAGAVSGAEALVYVLSAPSGSTAIIVRSGAEPEVLRHDDLTSRRVAQTLARPGNGPEEAVGYLPAQNGALETLDDEIATVSELIGPLLRSVAERLAEHAVETVCLIPTGLLTLLPLHALQWDQDGAATCLVDRFDVVTAPSGLARSVCLRRAQERDADGPALVVGNPLPHPAPLPGAEWEARVVAQVLESRGVTALIGTDATVDAVAASLPDAHIAHLSCHGSVALSPIALDCHLSLACARPLTGADLLQLPPLSARLVVASACETALSPGYETVDEALALSTVLLGAGAAGAIASLWAVDDRATALLMYRFYEEFGSGAAPPRALRVAMLWLRGLAPDDIAKYVRGRPALRAYRERAEHACGDGDRPFGAPSLWAAFVLSGA
jgi:CHAT domain-containing protein